MKFSTLAFALGLLASGQASRPIHAATLTASLVVTVTVVSSCQVSSPATTAATYAPVRANAASSISVTCTMPTPYNVSHNTSLTPSVSEITRKSSGSDTEAGTGNGAALSPGAYDYVTVTY